MNSPGPLVGPFSNVTHPTRMLVGFSGTTLTIYPQLCCPTTDIVKLAGILFMAKMKRIVQNGFAFKAKNNVEERDNASKRKIDVMENSIVQMEKMNSTVLSHPDNGQRNKNVTQPMTCSVSLRSIPLTPDLVFVLVFRR